MAKKSVDMKGHRCPIPVMRLKTMEARKELQPVLAVNPRFAPALEVIARIEGRPSAATGSAGR